MDIQEFGTDATAVVAEVVELVNVVSKVDSPWSHPETERSYAGLIRHGWDGEAPRCYVGRDGDRLVATSSLWTSEWDNTHLAWLDLSVHPDRRRRGHGSELLARMIDQARAMGRTSVGAEGWESSGTVSFAAVHAMARKSADIARRQHLDEFVQGVIDTMYADMHEAASSYELLRIKGHVPDDLLEAVAGITTAINDAPTDDLDIEDEVFTRERIVGYENAWEARGNSLYQLLARHRRTGALAGHTVVAVDQERPTIGDQHDTAVAREHRGHRLGLLLKTDMLRWLADEESQLKTIDTWNAESNHHMIAINEKLGYRTLGRGLAFQKDI